MKIKVSRKTVTNVVMQVLECHQMKSCCIPESANLVVKCTRRGKFDRRYNQQAYVLTVGRPNYGERKKIKQLIRKGIFDNCVHAFQKWDR
jgi:hypothetical protein